MSICQLNTCNKECIIQTVFFFNPCQIFKSSSIWDNNWDNKKQCIICSKIHFWGSFERGRTTVKKEKYDKSNLFLLQFDPSRRHSKCGTISHLPTCHGGPAVWWDGVALPWQLSNNKASKEMAALIASTYIWLQAPCQDKHQQEKCRERGWSTFCSLRDTTCTLSPVGNTVIK